MSSLTCVSSTTTKNLRNEMGKIIQPELVIYYPNYNSWPVRNIWNHYRIWIEYNLPFWSLNVWVDIWTKNLCTTRVHATHFEINHALNQLHLSHIPKQVDHLPLKWEDRCMAPRNWRNLLRHSYDHRLLNQESMCFMIHDQWLKHDHFILFLYHQGAFQAPSS